VVVGHAGGGDGVGQPARVGRVAGLVRQQKGDQVVEFIQCDAGFRLGILAPDVQQRTQRRGAQPGGEPLFSAGAAASCGAAAFCGFRFQLKITKPNNVDQ